MILDYFTFFSKLSNKLYYLSIERCKIYFLARFLKILFLGLAFLFYIKVELSGILHFPIRFIHKIFKIY